MALTLAQHGHLLRSETSGHLVFKASGRLARYPVGNLYGGPDWVTLTYSGNFKTKAVKSGVVTTHNNETPFDLNFKIFEYSPYACAFLGYGSLDNSEYVINYGSPNFAEVRMVSPYSVFWRYFKASDDKSIFGTYTDPTVSASNPNIRISESYPTSVTVSEPT